MNNNLIKPLLIALSFVPVSTIVCKRNNQNPPEQQVQEYSHFNDLGLAYLTLWGATLAHELGHALTAQLINGSPIKIVLGRRTYSDTIERPGIAIQGLDPRLGFCRFWSLADPYQNIAVIAAGPIVGAATATYLAYKYANKASQPYICATLAAVYSLIHNLRQFLPWYPDGADILKTIGKIRNEELFS